MTEMQEQQQVAAPKMRWYVVHVYSGMEKSVQRALTERIGRCAFPEQFGEVLVPTEEVVETRNNRRYVTERRMYAGYVLVHMVMNDDTWYVVRNTRGVTGFVGPGSKPVPLTDEEVASMGLMSSVAEAPFSIGDSVIVTSGIWEDTVGIVRQIDLKNKTVTINIDMFGRETPTELSFNDVKVCD